jgi:hypothetical protein
MNNTLAQQAQGLFIKHTIVLFVAVLFIVMIEEIPLTTDPHFSIFKIIFEIVSAYGAPQHDALHACMRVEQDLTLCISLSHSLALSFSLSLCVCRQGRLDCRWAMGTSRTRSLEHSATDPNSSSYLS